MDDVLNRKIGKGVVNFVILAGSKFIGDKVRDGAKMIANSI